MDVFWERVWNDSSIESYKKYIDLNLEYEFIEYFKREGLKNICDGACGFGKYSSILSYNGFVLSGFDVSEKAVRLTEDMLQSFSLPYESFKVCSITDVTFESSLFDGTIAHSVIDHLTLEAAYKAIDELFRITKKGGLIYISFDGLEEEDISSPHIILDDGSFKYTEGRREGMIFKYYSDQDIEKVLYKKIIIWMNYKKNGAREIILRKE
ncbi:MAG: class I SAM-dependent methyltransferase [Bacillota bacterium]|nr:class I SAM-dependent methyltransferase [Bacillota bacterium]